MQYSALRTFDMQCQHRVCGSVPAGQERKKKPAARTPESDRRRARFGGRQSAHRCEEEIIQCVKAKAPSCVSLSSHFQCHGHPRGEGERPAMMAAKVLREWTLLLSGDRGAAVVQRLQDRLGGDFFLGHDADSEDDDGRNFYEDVTGGLNCCFSGVPLSTQGWSKLTRFDTCFALVHQSLIHSPASFEPLKMPTLSHSNSLAHHPFA